jgi:ubiquinone biosynthesis protein
MVQEFRAAVQEELDFTREAENLGRFATDFQSFTHIVFPQVYWDQTSERVLTMSRMEGLKISMLDAQKISTIESQAVAQNLAEAVIRQILEFGFFHGDPHPGNLLVMEDNGICFLDCGMVGRLDERMRENLVLLVAAGIRRDSNTIVDILTEMNALPHDLQRSSITREIYLFLERYYRKPLKRIQVGSIIEEVMDLIRTYGIEIPPDFVLVGKSLVTVEGIGRRLDPDFDVTHVAAPYVREMILNSYGPKVLGRRLIEGSREIVRLMRDLPFDLREFARNLRENRIGITVEHRELPRLLKRLDQASTRISLSIVIASVVIASSVIILANHGPFLLGLPLWSILGFGIASALSFWLVLSYSSKDKK